MPARIPAVGPPESGDGRGRSPWAGAGAGLGQGWAILVELGAIIALFGYLGYRLDRVLGTRPVLFAVLMVLGYAGGVLHVWVWIRGRTERDPSARGRGGR
jgi:F0F1-type ATP synthase assembly protein I